MRSELAAMLNDAKRSADIIGRVMQLADMADKAQTYKELVDIAAVLDKAGDSFNEVKKVLNKFSELVATKAAQKALEAGDLGPIKTDLVTASVKSRQWYRVPSSRKADPIRFDHLMEVNGIPKEVYENELCRWHGPGIAEYCGSTGKMLNGTTSNDLSATVLYLSYRWKEKET